MIYQLRDYQESAVHAALNWIKYRSSVNGYVTAPGGSGKSVMIAKVAEACFDLGKTVIILARNEKLLRQNRAKISPQYPVGIYCAGLNEWDVSKPITIASIQSICNILVKPDVILVDECHEINPDSESETQYWKFFKACNNPHIIGFTATDFRTKSGKISWGEEIINIPIAPLIEAKYLVPPVNKSTNTPDLSNIRILAGEYNQEQLAELYEDEDLLYESVKKIKEYSAARNSVLIFVQSINHGKMLQMAMEWNDMPATMVSGDVPKDELSIILDDFETRKFKYLINCNLLTTGYDAPCVDMVAIIRSTMSKGLFEQMVYRGCRPYESKENFLLLDMGGNLMRHGALGSPYKAKKSKEEKRTPGKVCPQCESFCKIGEVECAECGFGFPPPEVRKVNHDYEADDGSNTVYDNVPLIYNVREVFYREHKGKNGKPNTLRVDYICDEAIYGNVSEWLSPHGESEWSRNKCHEFFGNRGLILDGDTKDFSMDDLIWNAQYLKKPIEITVVQEGKYQKVKGYKYATTSGEGNTKGISEVDLQGDFIPF